MNTKVFSRNNVCRGITGLFLFASLLFCASCDGDEQSSTNADQESGEPIHVNVSVGGINGFSNDEQSATRAATQPQSIIIPFNDDYRLQCTIQPAGSAPQTRAITSLKEGVKFRVLAYQNGIGISNFKKRADYQVQAGGNLLLEGDLILESGTYTFVCYTYNTLDALPLFDGSADLQVTGITSGTDFLRTVVTKRVDAGSVTLDINFDHACSALKLKVDASKMKQGNVTGCTASLAGLTNSTASWDVSKSVLTVQAGGADVVLPFAWSSLSAPVVESQEQIVMPIANAGLQLKFSSIAIEGTTHTLDKTVPLTGVTLAPGTSYICTVNFVPNATDIGGDGSNANSYIVLPGESYSLEAKYKGNGTTAQDKLLGGMGAKVVWQTSANQITDVNFSEGRINFKANAEGNALIALTDGANGSGNIVWSWHLWITDDKVKIERGAGTDNRWMDRNLGALGNSQADGARAYGFFYQWGRKDPFPGSASASATIEMPLYESDNKSYIVSSNPLKSATGGKFTPDYMIKNPEKFATGGKSQAKFNPAAWGGIQGAYTSTATTQKTINDPCPSGWKVPHGGKESWGVVQPSFIPRGTGGGVQLDDYGGWYPYQGLRWYSNYITRAGVDTYYFSSSISPTNYAVCLLIGGKQTSIYYYNYLGHGFSIRCVKDIK